MNKYFLDKETCEVLGVNEVYITETFYENEMAVIYVDGKEIRRKTRYNKIDGVYVKINGYRVCNYEFN